MCPNRFFFQSHAIFKGCHFAHGEHELKKFPRKNEEDDAAPDDVEINENMFGNNETTTVDYFQGGAAGGGRPCPIIEPENAAFFTVGRGQAHAQQQRHCC